MSVVVCFCSVSVTVLTSHDSFPAFHAASVLFLLLLRKKKRTDNDNKFFSYLCVRAIFQSVSFRFHDNHGKNIVLSHDSRTAERREDCGDGGQCIVISRDPMEVNKVYKVR